jgi:hypothetical protein
MFSKYLIVLNNEKKIIAIRIKSDFYNSNLEFKKIKLFKLVKYFLATI